MSEETRVYAKWLRAIADRMEERGIKEGSVQTVNVLGTTEATQPGDKVRHFKASGEEFFAITWEYENEP